MAIAVVVSVLVEKPTPGMHKFQRRSVADIIPVLAPQAVSQGCSAWNETIVDCVALPETGASSPEKKF
ncbi:MAG: hypothetical protein R3D67_16060 [Hyphomicrobiaceae bacterium]